MVSFGYARFCLCEDGLPGSWIERSAQRETTHDAVGAVGAHKIGLAY